MKELSTALTGLGNSRLHEFDSCNQRIDVSIQIVITLGDIYDVKLVALHIFFGLSNQYALIGEAVVICTSSEVTSPLA